MPRQRWLLPLSKMLLLLACITAAPAESRAQVWTVVAIDPKGDGRDPSSADAAQVSYRYDKERDLLWFRISLWGTPNAAAFGVNIAVDTGAEEMAKMNWWGRNKDFKFDRLITASVTRASGGYRGTMGVADTAGVRARNFNNLLQNNLQISVEGDSIIIGLKRTDLTDKMQMNFIAAVGSTENWNDDVPNTRSITLDLAAPRSAHGLREIDTSRNNFVFPSDYKTLADNQPPVIAKEGTGPETLILISGVYSGSHVFDGFVRRNLSRYQFYVVTPPGLNGTAARPLPPESTSYGELTWTRRLERDIADLIRRERLNKPVLVVHGFPGSLAAEDLATQNPGAVGGVIEIASMPVQPFPSFKDPSRKTPAPLDERVEMVNEGWAKKWFRYVTPETWESNNYPTAMYANDTDQAEQTRRQVESTPLPVKIRYLTEFMAADHTRELADISVPLLALKPGFNQQLLADPANGFLKSAFQDVWDPFAKNPQISLQTIPNARALILDDQPKIADDAIAAFAENRAVKRNVE